MLTKKLLGFAACGFLIAISAPALSTSTETQSTRTAPNKQANQKTTRLPSSAGCMACHQSDAAALSDNNADTRHKKIN